MESKIIDGKAFAENLTNKIANQVADFKKKTNITPGLTVVLVGDNPASEVYVKNKVATTQRVGMNSNEIRLPANTSQDALLKIIDELNNDPKVHGILVQLPLPAGLDDHEIIQRINPKKDVDGFHLVNVGLLSTGGKDALVPCTPYGCLLLLQDHFGADLAGLKCAVLGRSNIVGKPMMQLLLSANATVTVMHSKTKNLASELQQYDVVVAAIGKPNFVMGSWLKPGAVVIDVGINRLKHPDGRSYITGDVDFASCNGVAGAITKVPGGVGPMTIACLLRNTMVAAGRIHGVDIV